MATENLIVEQGATFEKVIRWETTPIIYKPITAMTQAAPIAITVPNHGAPNGWRAAVVDAKGMVELNAADIASIDDAMHLVTVLDTNTIEFNDVSSLAFKAYKGSGALAYFTPAALTGYTARMTVRDRIGGTQLSSLTSGTGEITIDTANFTITLVLTPTTTAAFTWKKGVYDLEMVSPSGRVTRILSGSITLSKEVTS